MANLSFAIIIISLFSIFYMTTSNEVHGHGLSKDQYEIIDNNGKSFTVEGRLYPSLIEDIENGSKLEPTMLIRTFDSLSNETVKDLEYNLTIKTGNKVILSQCFIPQDGIIFAKLIPDYTAEVEKIYLSEHIKEHNSCISGIGKDNPASIKSRIFSTGGLYHFSLELKPVILTYGSNVSKIDIVQKKSVDLFITVGQTEQFDIPNIDQSLYDINLTHIMIKSYYDKIHNFNYSEKNQTQVINFQMPFDWNQSYVNQVSFLHHELFIPKDSFFAKKKGYIGTLNNNILPTKSILIDDYSSDIYRIIHMVISSDKLDQFVRKMTISANLIPFPDQALFSLFTSEQPKFPLELLSLKNKYLFQISWNPEKIIFEKPITFIINIQNPETGDLLRHTYFDFIILNNDKEIYREHISSDFGALTKDFIFPYSKDNRFSILIDKINGENDGALLNLIVD
ncbi:MAG: hypothetical protein DA328_03015 [Nitrososphaeraceae archaeon]|nr:hypothetical protein [Nitrososphaeraceae archaeon]